MHLLFVYGINAEELVSPKNMEMAQKDQQSIADKEKLLWLKYYLKNKTKQKQENMFYIKIKWTSIKIVLIMKYHVLIKFKLNVYIFFMKKVVSLGLLSAMFLAGSGVSNAIELKGVEHNIDLGLGYTAQIYSGDSAYTQDLIDSYKTQVKHWQI